MITPTRRMPKKLSLQSYAEHLKSAANSQNGKALASLYTLADSHSAAVFTALSRETYVDHENPGLSIIQSVFGPLPKNTLAHRPWAEMASKHLAVISHVKDAQAQNDLAKVAPAEKAARLQLELLNMLLRWMTSQNSAAYPNGWALPILYATCRDLRSLAILADNGLRSTGQKPTLLEEASRAITKAFTACLSDRGATFAESRRMGTYYMAVLLFKTYFKLRTLALCKNVVRGITSTSDLPDLESFPKSHQVGYRYYMGVFAFLNEKYEDAEKDLSYAFENCHRSCPRNRELILNYLIPLRMLSGILPKRKLLKPYPHLLELFTPFINAYRKGDVKAFDAALFWAEVRLLNQGTFLLVERCREGVLRGLFRKVWILSGRGNRIPIDTFRKALEFVKVDMESIEVECLVANMIFKGFMKGYISHERQMVVLSNKDPFPGHGNV